MSAGASESHHDDGTIAFGAFRLTPSRRLLLRDEAPVALGARALDVLIHLATRPGVIVDKDTLIDAVWSGRAVEDNNLTVQIAALRRALSGGQDGSAIIRTIAGRGYVFVAETKAREPLLPSTLPRPATPFIGRIQERDEIVQRLGQSRLVTITGMGGLGKTRVALQLANELTADYPDGLWFVDLSVLSDSAMVSETVTTALGIGSGERPAIERLTAFLANRRGLLVLDNCEHVIDAVADLVNATLAGCAAMTILATSRESLFLPGEIVVRLPPLPFPTEPASIDAASALGHDAVRLFVDRAATLAPDFVLDDQTAPWVARICADLDGIALAIEMAVPRLKLLTPAILADRLSERFQLLARPDRSASARHRTLRAMIDWSYDLLTDDERALLCRLSLFAGGGDLAAIAALSGESEWDLLDQLSSLVEKSLVIVDIDGSHRRFRLLETIRQYANEKRIGSGETDGRRLHAEYFAVLFETAEATWPNTQTGEWLDTYADDVDNLRAALKWAFGADGDSAIGVRLVAASYPLWWDLPQMPVPEGRHWFDLATNHLSSETAPAVAARFWLGVSWRDMRLSDPIGLPAARRAVDLFRVINDPLRLGGALWRVGANAFSGRNGSEMLELCIEGERILRPLGPSKWLVMNLVRHADTDMFAGRLDAAVARYNEAKSMAEGLDHWYGRLVCTTNMSEALFELDQRERALDLLQAMRLALSPRRRPPLLAPLVSHLLIAGRTHEMLDTAREAVTLAGMLGLGAALAWVVESLALHLTEQGDYAMAARFAGYTRRIHPETTLRVGGRLAIISRLEAALGAALPAAQRAQLAAEGAAWTDVQAADQARLVCA